jgi:hypothetical protein
LAVLPILVIFCPLSPTIRRISKSLVYFDWKTVIYIYVCRQCAYSLCCQIRADNNSSTCTFTTRKSVPCTGACANEIIPNR